VRGHRGTVALTSAGEIAARVLVDATGWRAALVRSGSPGVRAPRYFGLEAEVPASFATGLHFYFWPEILPDGYLWAFPAGATTRVGLISYRARTQLGPALDLFLRRLGLPSGPRHGGFLGGAFGPPVVDGVFVVGDAAGHCLPFTGEGIRLAVRAGGVAGRLIAEALGGRISLDEARARYRTFALHARRSYRLLEWMTAASLVVPATLLGAIAAWSSRPGPLRVLLGHYLRIFSPKAAHI
jgi:flavin-dependent dehydrogenase